MSEAQYDDCDMWTVAFNSYGAGYDRAMKEMGIAATEESSNRCGELQEAYANSIFDHEKECRMTAPPTDTDTETR